MPADASVDELMKLFGERVNHEHELIAHRMTWLMALNGFVSAAIGLGLVNTVHIPEAVLKLVVVGLATLGVLSNASCFFSNYWGNRAIGDASYQVHTVLSGADYRHLSAATWSRLRLYGKDPDERPLPPRFWRPPTTVLHPWLLLPVAFGVAYLLVPLIGLNRGVSGRPVGAVDFWDVLIAFIPLIVTALTFGPLMVADARWRRSEQDRRRKDEAWLGPVRTREDWERDVLPRVRGLSHREVARRLGSSAFEARSVVRGAFMPHERHWADLLDMAGQTHPPTGGADVSSASGGTGPRPPA